MAAFTKALEAQFGKLLIKPLWLGNREELEAVMQCDLFMEDGKDGLTSDMESAVWKTGTNFSPFIKLLAN